MHCYKSLDNFLAIATSAAWMKLYMYNGKILGLIISILLETFIGFCFVLTVNIFLHTTRFESGIFRVRSPLPTELLKGDES